MYSRKAWGGSVEPFILARFLRYQSTGDDAVSDPTLAFIIFEWQDEALIGIPSRDDPDEVGYSARNGYKNSADTMEYRDNTSAARMLFKKAIVQMINTDNSSSPLMPPTFPEARSSPRP